MRTQLQIAEQYKDVPQDIFGAYHLDLLEFMSWDTALSCGALKPDATQAEFVEAGLGIEPTRERIVAKMVDYLPFAIGKAEDHRGLSASRSITHFDAWVFLLDDADVAQVFRDAPYENYGMPKLRAIAVALGRKDLVASSEAKRMADGLDCREGGCDEGCGK